MPPRRRIRSEGEKIHLSIIRRARKNGASFLSGEGERFDNALNDLHRIRQEEIERVTKSREAHAKNILAVNTLKRIKKNPKNKELWEKMNIDKLIWGGYKGAMRKRKEHDAKWEISRRFKDRVRIEALKHALDLVGGDDQLRMFIEEGWLAGFSRRLPLPFQPGINRLSNPQSVSIENVSQAHAVLREAFGSRLTENQLTRVARAWFRNYWNVMHELENRSKK